MGKIKVLKFQIRSAQNVGMVWISRNKILLTPFGAIPGIFFHGPQNLKNIKILHIFLGGPMGPIHPVWTITPSDPGQTYFVIEILALNIMLE